MSDATETEALELARLSKRVEQVNSNYEKYASAIASSLKNDVFTDESEVEKLLIMCEIKGSAFTVELPIDSLDYKVFVSFRAIEHSLLEKKSKDKGEKEE